MPGLEDNVFELFPRKPFEMAGNFRRVATDFVEDLPRSCISAAIVA